MRAETLLKLFITSKLLPPLLKEVKTKTDGEWIIVVCHLGTSKRIGETVAALLNPDDYARRKPDEDLWTFLYPLDAWQSFRAATGVAKDNFEPNSGQGFAVVTDQQVLTGRILDD